MVGVHAAIPQDAMRTPLSITFAFVATHNHFVLDRGGKVFNVGAGDQAAGGGDRGRPSRAAGGAELVDRVLLAQAEQPRQAAMGGAARIESEAWDECYEFTGTTLQDFPLPQSPAARASGVSSTSG